MDFHNKITVSFLIHINSEHLNSDKDSHKLIILDDRKQLLWPPAKLELIVKINPKLDVHNEI